MTQRTKQSIVLVGILILLNILATLYSWQWDLTADKRYTLTPQSQQLVAHLKYPLQVNLYLNGEMNASFDKLRSRTIDMLNEMAIHAPQGIRLNNINVTSTTGQAQTKLFTQLERRGIQGLSVNETDAYKKHTQQIIFPEAEFIYHHDTIPVNLLSQDNNLKPQEILNVSESNLEYLFTDAIRRLTITKPERIAFLEGQRELSEPYVYEATKVLSEYYQIDRGSLTGDPAALTPYKVLIVAGPVQPFSESEKFVLDQYLMHGGSILWLIDGTKINENEFEANGESPTLKNDLNLDDLFFTWGIRINSVTLQDLQCTPIRLATNMTAGKSAYTTLPWFFAPLLIPNPSNAITAHISPLKSEQVSSLSIIRQPTVQSTILLSTSSETHILHTPEAISLRYVEMPAQKSYFHDPAQPVAVLLEGNFSSAFQHQLRPDSCTELRGGRIEKSTYTRQIVVSCASIIQNELGENDNQTQPIPLGYDQITDQQLGNSDFIINAVNYLAGNSQWLQLRTRNNRLLLLNKTSTEPNKLLFWQIFNVGGPIVFFLLLSSIFVYSRKKKKQ